MAKKKQKHYVNNKDFLEAIIKHKKECEEARSSGKKEPRVPDYIGQCVLDIARRLARRPNFSGYSYKDDMIMDGVENCIKYVEKFDPGKTSNPFAYFTQIIWFAFLQRIAKEKKSLYIKLKSSQSMITLGETYSDASDIKLNLNIDADYIDDFIQEYEDKIQRDKEKKKVNKNDTSDN